MVMVGDACVPCKHKDCPCYSSMLFFSPPKRSPKRTGVYLLISGTSLCTRFFGDKKLNSGVLLSLAGFQTESLDQRIIHQLKNLISSQCCSLAKKLTKKFIWIAALGRLLSPAERFGCRRSCEMIHLSEQSGNTINHSIKLDLCVPIYGTDL